VIEDDAAMREGFAMLLEFEGFEVRQAANGREALEILDRWRADAILLDLMMPVMNGWEFRMAQLGRPEIADIPVVIVSGYAEAERGLTALNAAGFLQKPAPAKAVVDKLGAVIGG